MPNDENRALIAAARQEIGDGAFLGVHIRRGDHKSMSWKYHGGHVPLSEYVRATTASWSKFQKLNLADLWIATDTVDLVMQFTEMLPDNFRTFSLISSERAELKALTPAQPYNQSTWNDLPAEARILETRGVIVDFALFSGAWAEGDHNIPEAVICTMT
jgi:hypothetical protein